MSLPMKTEAEMSTYDILVLGATGFTGKLITRYLYAHPQRSSFSFAVGARSRKKLDELAEAINLDSSVARVEVDVTNFEMVEAVVQKAKVIINTVGPYWRWGTPVVRACVRHGIHYVDLTGETPWVRDIITEFHSDAVRSGTIVVPQCGFDSIPSDLTVHLSNKTLKAISPDSLIDSSTSAFKMFGGFSGGTISSMLVTLEEIPWPKLRASALDYALSPVQGQQTSRPKFLYKLPYLSPSIVGSYFIMGSSNKAIVQRTWGLLESEAQLPSSSQQQRYGPAFKYDEFMVTPGKLTAVFISLCLAIGGLCLAFFKPARWLFKRLAPQPGEGPAIEGMEQGFFEVTNVTSSTDSPPIVVKTSVHGRGDPGYLLTAAMISESALSLLLSYNDLPAIGRRGGVLTPMTAFGDVLIERLRLSGRFQFSSEMTANESRKTR